MLFSDHAFAVILRSLGLASQGSFKPSNFPVVFALAPAQMYAPNPAAGQTFSWPLENSDSLGAADVANEYQSQRVPSTLDSSDCNIPAYDAPSINEPFAPFDPVKANIYRYRQQQSVNLGSWFVHEQWMTPSVFKCASGKQVSELDIASGWGSTDAARSILEKHWDTFITQRDFDYLASIGINTVRLPIGYWSLGPTYCQDTPFAGVADVYTNSWNRVVHAIKMAEQTGIGVLVDLHGAPGSQNGQPHSGISDGQTNLFDDPSNADKTMEVLTFLMRQLSQVTNVVGIQILNEPKNIPELADFYTRAITTMRNISSEAASFPLYIHDGFDLERFSQYVANRSDFVVQDHHSYFVFTASDGSESASDHTVDVGTTVLESLEQASTTQHHNLVIDEWSCALSPQSLADERDPDQAQKGFCTGQMGAYSSSVAGWSFWAYMKEDCDNDPGWCFKAAVGQNLPSTFFSYGSVPTHTPFPLQSPEASEESDAELSTPRSRFSAIPDHATSGTVDRQLEWDQDTTVPAQRAITKGYSDGYLTAKIFAAYGMSRLGFVDQYVNDSLAAVGPTAIAEDMQSYYRDWFKKGLMDGEAIIMSGNRV